MKATPKLQDTLEVFLEQIEDIKVLMSETKNIAPELNNKIQSLKQIKIEPNLDQLTVTSNKIKTELTQEINRLGVLFQNNYEKLEEMQKKNKEGLSNYFFYVLVAFVITSGAIFFGISAQNSRSKIKDDLAKVKSYNTALQEYIKESKQIDKYNKWLNSKTAERK